MFSALAVTAAVVIGLVPLSLSDAPEPPRPCRTDAWPCARPVATQPTVVASPRFLSATYRAPQGAKSPSVGRLMLPRLRIAAAVASVGWDRDAMSVPDDPAVLGWFEPSAGLDDLAGVSLIAGHVSDAADRPGPLARLVDARIGDVVAWRGNDGRTTRFRVVTIARYPRASGLPPSLFKVDGPHTLRLVTCATRTAAAGGIHYVDNLVVSAIAQ